jgi:hypothetical protein
MKHHIFGFSLYVLAILFCVIPNVGLARLVNYEDDPNLKLAMQYDLESSKTDEASNQALAEKYYLKYLETATDHGQRAKVYSHLGVLFATAYRPEKGEKPDFQKSVMYMKKVLEEEPLRICRETISARGFMSTPAQTPQEAVAYQMESYAWLLSIKKTIAEADADSDIWLPDRPNTKLTETELRSLKELFTGILELEPYNMASRAANSLKKVDRITLLHAIMDRFPDNPDIAKEVQKRLDIQNGVKRDTAQLSSATLTPPPTPTVVPTPTPASTAVPTPAAVKPEAKDASGMAWVFAGTLVCVLVGGEIWYIKRRR